MYNKLYRAHVVKQTVYLHGQRLSEPPVKGIGGVQHVMEQWKVRQTTRLRKQRQEAGQAFHHAHLDTFNFLIKYFECDLRSVETSRIIKEQIGGAWMKCSKTGTNSASTSC